MRTASPIRVCKQFEQMCSATAFLFTFSWDIVQFPCHRVSWGFIAHEKGEVSCSLQIQNQMNQTMFCVHRWGRKPRRQRLDCKLTIDSLLSNVHQSSQTTAKRFSPLWIDVFEALAAIHLSQQLMIRCCFGSLVF